MSWTIEEKTEALDIIFDRVKEGESIRAILPNKDRQDNLPNRDTFYTWIKEDVQLSDQYTRATEERSTKIFEEMFEIADDGMNDWMEIKNKEGESVGWKINGESIQRSRLRIDTRKWALSKMNPKKYSDKIQVDTTEFKEQPLFPDVPANNSNK